MKKIFYILSVFLCMFFLIECTDGGNNGGGSGSSSSSITNDNGNGGGGNSSSSSSSSITNDNGNGGGGNSSSSSSSSIPSGNGNNGGGTSSSSSSIPNSNSGNGTSSTNNPSASQFDTYTPQFQSPSAKAGFDWRDQIIYFIMTDRFNNGDPSNDPPGNQTDPTKANFIKYFGGDLKGIIDQVDYIKSLGATAIWITPVVANVRENDGYTGYHGYWAWDMSVVDETLTPPGFNETQRYNYYKYFIDKMHEKGIVVIQDIVVNHMGNVICYPGLKPPPEYEWEPPFTSSNYKSSAQFVEDAYPPATYDWVTKARRTKPPKAPFDNLNSYHHRGKVTDHDDTNQAWYGDLGGLPDLNNEDSGVRSALIDIYGKWIEAGVDGFRIDTVKYLPNEFWDVFNPAMRVKAKTLSKKFMQFGEVFIGWHPTTAQYVDGYRLDSLVNFHLYYALQQAYSGKVDDNGKKWTALLTQELIKRRDHRLTAIGDGGPEVNAREGAINFIDNHDIYRFMTSAGGNASILRNALMYIMTTQGIPSIFYSTENESTHVVGAWGSDPTATWAGNDGITHPDGTKYIGDTGSRVPMPNFTTTGKPTFDLIKKLSDIRKNNSALRRGDINVLFDNGSPASSADESKGIVFCFGRGDGVQSIIVAINFSSNPVTDFWIPTTSYGDGGVTVANYAAGGDTLTEIFDNSASKTVEIKYNHWGDKRDIPFLTGVNIPAYGMRIYKKQ